MTESLIRAKNCINSVFLKDWWTDIFDEQGKVIDVSSRFDSVGREVQVEFIDYLNHFILRGEYAEPAFEVSQLNEFNNVFLEIRSYKDGRVATENYRDEIDYTLEDILEPLEFSITIVKELATNYHRRLLLSDRDVLISFNTRLRAGLRNNNFDAEIEDHLNNLLTNAAIADMDQSLSCEKADKMLQRLYQRILALDNELPVRPYSPLIRLKAVLLRNKLLLREREKRRGRGVFTIEDGAEVEVGRKHTEVTPEFDSWLKYAYAHYELGDGWPVEIAQFHEFISTKKIAECSLFELYKKLKYFKDVEQNPKVLREIHEELLARWDQSGKDRTNLDSLALRIGINYTINILLSVERTNKDKSKTSVKEAYELALKVQSKTQIKNFFPHYKYLGFLVDEMEELQNQNKAIASIEEMKLLLQEAETQLQYYSDNVYWTTKNYPFVFQLPFRECCIDIPFSGIDRLFIHSSFLFPLPKNKYQAELTSYTSSVANFRSAVNILENVGTELEELKKLKAELEVDRKNSKNSEVKFIELISIFTAIIAFSASSLPTFSAVKTAWDAAAFMLALSTSLATFVLLMSLMLRWDRVKYKFVVLITATLLVATLWLLLGFCTEC
jgi:hypothetical protein